MQIIVGKDFKNNPVSLDTAKLINGHLQISGVTGMGKSHQLRRLVTAMIESAAQSRRPIRFHVFDPHGDLVLPMCSSVKFSEETRYGYSPLDINPNPDYGGVRRSIQKFLTTVENQKKLGSKQQAALRYLLEDLYLQRGFHPDKPETWIPDDPAMVHTKMAGKEGRIYLDVAKEHRERFKALTQSKPGEPFYSGFDSDPGFMSWWVNEDYYSGDLLMWEPKEIFKSFPTIDDLLRFTKLKIKAQICGTNSAAMAKLKDVSQAARMYYRRVEEAQKLGKGMHPDEKAKLESNLDKAKEDASDAYNSFMDAIRTGREMEDMIRYSSMEVLTSVLERLVNLKALGILNPNAPPFDSRERVWRYDMRYLEISTQCMLVELVSGKVFERAMQRGFQNDVIEVLVVDEGARYVSDDPEYILNKISNEARKFGLGLWVTSTSPEHFSDDFLKATGTILVLGLSDADHRNAATKLGLRDTDLLARIKPRETALLKVKNIGEANDRFQLIQL